MTYDNAGNMLTRKKYSYTTGTLGSVLSTQTFTYGKDGWGDVLTKINSTTVTSDASGNILSDGTNTYTWKNGRQLATVTRNGTTWTNTYDASGMRTQRVSGSTVYRYTYEGTQLAQMTVGSNTLLFTYGINGQPMSVKYNGVDYYYITNAQGDVVGILNSSGTDVVTYTYDAWGNLLSTTGSMASSLGLNNPLRYRGYVYDRETGLYYLQSRYYNPTICRFISADNLVAPETSVGCNQFIYCCNNPVSYSDSTGHWIETVFDLFSLGVSVVDVVINPLDPWAWAGLAGDALDLIPFATGIGESIKGMRVIAKGADLADDTLTTIRFAKAVDFTDDAWDTIKTLDRAGDFTKSTASAGIKIHKGYKVLQAGKEYSKIPGIRMDFFDLKNIFELKPYNRRSLVQGVNQLIRYSNSVDYPVFLILEFY